VGPVALAEALAAAVNVIFLSSDYPPQLLGGVGTYTDEFARHLVRRGHQAFVITRTDGTPCEYVERGVRVWRVKPEPIRWLDPVRDLYPEFTARLEYSWAVARALRRVTRRWAIHLVESCESRAEGFCYFLLHRRPPLLIKLHTPDRVIFRLNQRPATRDVDLMLTMEEWWLRRATRLVGLTQALTRQVGRLYRLPIERVPHVRVPVDTAFFCPAPSRDRQGPFRVLYVGRLEFRKGVHVLLRAIPRVLRRIPEVHFTLIGADSGLRGLVERSFADARCAGRLTWIPSASRPLLREAYQSADVCVVPSLWDNHPTVCLEAMSCGRAVVASRAGGIPEIIEHGRTGHLVPPGSSYALAQGIVELLADPARRSALGRAARARMEAHYSVERVFDETIALYERLLSAKWVSALGSRL
jgi:glycosyltransferase involved in cell wall biosynthesis